MKQIANANLFSNFIISGPSREKVINSLKEISKKNREAIIIFDDFLHSSSFDYDLYFLIERQRLYKKSIDKINNEVGKLIMLSRCNGEKKIIRNRATLKEAINEVSRRHISLKPYFIISYSQKEARYRGKAMGIISDVTFRLLADNKSGRIIYELPAYQSYLRLSEAATNSLGIINDFIKMGADFAPSIIDICYNAENRFREKSSQDIPNLEIKNIEFESKSTCSVDGAHLLVYSFGSKENILGFRIQEKYPYLIQRRLLIKFSVFNDKVYKFIYSGIKNPKVVFKNDKCKINGTPIKGLLKRREIEKVGAIAKRRLLITDEDLRSWAFKIKKVFWIKNTKTGRLYHIAFDKTYSRNKSLMQMEVEYAGILGGSLGVGAEKYIVEDINIITSELRKSFSFLSSSIQRKQEWVLSK
ncbi:hypothetical protein KJ784_04435 [Patescibacteria group bacterium]|nr:hypothetical protein [Patescibacteria group bacterium]